MDTLRGLRLETRCLFLVDAAGGAEIGEERIRS